jgi:hypothetical protein
MITRLFIGLGIVLFIFAGIYLIALFSPERSEPDEVPQPEKKDLPDDDDEVIHTMPGL